MNSPATTLYNGLPLPARSPAPLAPSPREPRQVFLGSLLGEEATRRWALDLARALERLTGDWRRVGDASHPPDRASPGIVMTSLERPLPGTCRLARESDAVIVLLPRHDHAYFRCRLFERELGRPIIPVILNDGGPRDSHRPAWLHRHQPIIVPSDDVPAGIRALTRRLLKRRVGLALSAGSAKGLAHIGAIQVLEEEGIEIDAVAGVSMGAYVGACWCYGHQGRDLEALAATIQSRKDLLQLTDPVFPPRQGFLKGVKARRRLAESIDYAAFEDLARPLYVVLTDLDTLASTVFSEGDVASAVHASLAIPGICEPVRLNGRRYTDGGASDPLPVDVLENLGIDHIIAVNTQPSLADLEALAMGQGYGHSPRWGQALRTAGRYLNRSLNYFAAGNLLDTVMRGLQAAQVRLAEASGSRADVYIHAYPTATRWYAFNAHANAIASGRAAALAKRSALQTLKAKVQP